MACCCPANTVTEPGPVMSAGFPAEPPNVSVMASPSEAVSRDTVSWIVAVLLSVVVVPPEMVTT